MKGSVFTRMRKMFPWLQIFMCGRIMAETFKEIITNQVEIPQIKFLFTTDLRQNEETLANTLVEFKLVDGKYKMENVELKLIG